jgi:hypothetical protein
MVNPEQGGVAKLQANGLLDMERVGHRQIATNNLEVRGIVEVAPGLPVILSK